MRLQQLREMSVRDFRGLSFVVAVGCMSGAGVRAATSIDNWEEECVGRMQLRLPGAVEAAATSDKTLLAEIERGRLQPPSFFVDGQQAGYSNLWVGGSLMVSHPLSDATFTEMTAKLRTARQRSRDWATKNAKTNDGVPRVFAIPTTKSPQSVAWKINDSYTLLQRVGASALYWRVNAQPSDQTTAAGFTAVAQAEPRQTYSMPMRAGVCVPYAFIPDDGQQARTVRVTYRSVDYPDVTIWLDDSTSVEPGPDQIASHFTPEYKTNFFWTQRYQSRKSVKMLWHHLHDVKLDGRKGVASFVELTREDDTIDYGYLAVVRGDPNAKTDTPDLMLYVVRDAKNAIAKGKQPIDKAEFLEMAEAIAASVKHRPTK
jgi:Tle cognate immunity protein 4 C-terminal domain